METTTNVLIWSLHISWSVHPWRNQVDQALKLFAEPIVSSVYDRNSIFRNDSKINDKRKSDLYTLHCCFATRNYRNQRFQTVLLRTLALKRKH